MRATPLFSRKGSVPRKLKEVINKKLSVWLRGIKMYRWLTLRNKWTDWRRSLRLLPRSLTWIYFKRRQGSNSFGLTESPWRWTKIYSPFWIFLGEPLSNNQTILGTLILGKNTKICVFWRKGNSIGVLWSNQGSKRRKRFLEFSRQF